MARDDQRRPGTTAGFTCRRCTARSVGAVGATSPPRESAVNKESGSASAIKTFKNTELGKPGSRKAKRPTGNGWSSAARTTASARVPQGGLLLVGAADAEGSHRGIDLGFRARQGVLAGRTPRADGDTARDAVWKRLAELIAETGRMPRARRCWPGFAPDTGFATQEAYAFVRACRDPRVMPVKACHAARP